MNEADEFLRELGELLATRGEGGVVDEERLASLVQRAPDHGLEKEVEALIEKAKLRANVADAPQRITRGGGYKPTPGLIPPPGAVVFVCPEGDFEWVRRAVGEKIPLCPVHQRPLHRR